MLCNTFFIDLGSLLLRHMWVLKVPRLTFLPRLKPFSCVECISAELYMKITCMCFML